MAVEHWPYEPRFKTVYLESRRHHPRCTLLPIEAMTAVLETVGTRRHCTHRFAWRAAG